MQFGFCGPSYTTRSNILADEECINLYLETNQAQSVFQRPQLYGGQGVSAPKALFWTPGLSVFSALPNGPVRGSIEINGRAFAVGGPDLIELASDGTQTVRGIIANDGLPVSIAKSNIQLLIVSAGRAYCYTLATNVLTEVTSQLVGAPAQAVYSDGYFIVSFQNSNKFQISNLLDGTTWDALFVNAVSVFPDNIVALAVNHRELWVFGERHTQPYQDTGSAEIFDVIPSGLIEKGCAAAFSPCLLDNSVFWVDEDDRGARMAWRSNAYTPQRVSTPAVEADLATYADVSGMTTYAYQDGGHLCWEIYIPGAQWSWVYDVSEGAWHKRAEWVKNAWKPHYSQNYVYAFGKHLVGDWNTGNLYEMNVANMTDNGLPIRRYRRAPTIINEGARLFHAELTFYMRTGLGPQPPLTDGAGNPRPPQCMLRWSDDSGQTWSNEYWHNCGFAGQYSTRVIYRRLGQSRYRVYEWSATDPIPWAISDAFLRLGGQQ
jgi:hypothetical protein